MKPTMKPFSALLAVALCLCLTGTQVGESQHVPARCMCPKSRSRIQSPVSDFRVVLPRTGCGDIEIIVILEKDKKQVCLSPERRQGKTLLRCWRRKTMEGRGGKKCIRQLKRQTRNGHPRMHRSKAKKAI